MIERDVTRAFGNMPPHKTCARHRQDSIVRALVSSEREEILGIAIPTRPWINELTETAKGW